MNFSNVSLTVLFVGIVVVFFVLILLVLIIRLFSITSNKFFSRFNFNKDIRNFVDKQINITSPQDENIDKNNYTEDSDIAAISATVAYIYLNDNKKYKIYSVKRIFYADNRL